MPTASLFEFDKAGLIEDPDNCNEHNDKNLQAIEDSVEETGFLRSIAVDENNVVRAGNGTMQIAKKRGAKILYVDVDDDNTLVAVRRAGLSEIQKTRAGLWDNETARLAKRKNSAIRRLTTENPGQLLMKGIISEKDQSKILREHENAQMLAAGGADDDQELTRPSTPKERASGIRMVQVMLAEDTQPIFVARAKALGKLLGSKNLSDAVIDIVTRAHAEWLTVVEEVLSPNEDDTASTQSA